MALAAGNPRAEKRNTFRRRNVGASLRWRKALRFFALHLLLVLVLVPVARAIEFEGVQVPETQQVGGKTLHLNGYGLRTYSILRVRIYVAALYLEHLNSDARAILASPETKLMSVTFVRDIDVDAARKSWRDGLVNNCQPPCQLDPHDLSEFLASVPAMRAGENFSLLFTREGATISANGQHIGSVSHPAFAEAILATFLGPKPASPELESALLTGVKP